MKLYFTATLFLSVRTASFTLMGLLLLSSLCLLSQRIEVADNTVITPIDPIHVGAITDKDNSIALDGPCSIYVPAFEEVGEEILGISEFYTVTDRNKKQIIIITNHN